MARDIKTDTREIRNDTALIKDETSQILEEIARLHARLPQDDRVPNAYGFTLQKYLEDLSIYAETNADLSDDELESGAYVDSMKVDIQPDWDFMLESPSRPETPTQSTASKPAQDEPPSKNETPSQEQRHIPDPWTPPESRKSSFVAIPSNLLLPASSMYRRHSISDQSESRPPQSEVRRTSLAPTSVSIDQASLSTAGIPINIKKKGKSELLGIPFALPCCFRFRLWSNV